LAESQHLAAAGLPVPPGGGPSPRTSSATGHPPLPGACPSAVPGPLTSATIEPGTPARSALRPAYPR